MSTPARQNILSKIKAALAQPTPPPFPEQPEGQHVYQPQQADSITLFAEQFTALGGRFIYCADHADFAAQFRSLVQAQAWANIYCAEPGIAGLLPGMPWYGDVATSDAALTSCEHLVARTGSMVLSAAAGRVPSVYAPIHVCVAYTAQLVYDLGDALQATEARYGHRLPSLLTLATGPSRTADIEKTLVVGVHGPKEVYCFLIGAAD